MNEAIEKIQQYCRRRKAYEKAYSCGIGTSLPTRQMAWIYQVDGAYLDRFSSVLSRIQSQQGESYNYSVCAAPAERGMAQGFRHFEIKAALCFLEEHVLLRGLLPFEFFKHIHKIMFCDRVCSDPATLISNVNSLLNKFKGLKKLLKIQCTPKHLEDNIVTIMGNENCEFTVSESKCTHVLQVAYCPVTGLLHYGLVEKMFSESHGLTSEALVKMKLNGIPQKNGDGVHDAPIKTRPCRAYYKMSEIVESVFPSLGWHLGDLSRNNSSLAMDVGASPGGWSQYLAEAGYAKVVAVDPGELLASVLADQRITHVQSCVEDPLVQGTLRELTASSYQRISLLVCDVNFAPGPAAKTLAEHCFPWLEGHGRCHCCSCATGYTTTTTTPPSHAKSAELRHSFVVLTLKMLKNPKQRHIDLAVAECTATMTLSHTRARPSKCSCPCSCWSFNLVHLAANSANERTLICKLH